MTCHVAGPGMSGEPHRPLDRSLTWRFMGTYTPNFNCILSPRSPVSRVEVDL